MRTLPATAKALTIGRVAREAGVGVETVRFYEREGLLELPSRRASGYRQYQPEAIARLQFIKQAQRLGFTLREIKELLALKLELARVKKERDFLRDAAAFFAKESS